jgi:large conductance mechanosensitive channel
MSIIKEFKKFATKGNVVDMAVGIIIGAAFGKIVSSLVNDVLMPPIGKLIGNVNFTDLYVTLDGKAYETLAAAKAAGAPILSYGNFLQTVFDFIIVAFAIFMMIKAMNRLKKKEEEKAAAPAEPTAQEKLLTEIRDILKKEK